MNKVEILIISNKYDFSTDYICVDLENRNKKYLRLNRDQLNNYTFVYDLLKKEMLINFNNKQYIINERTLKSVYYRAPIYLRDNYQPDLTAEEQLYRNQWTAFIRNLSLFEKAKWVNNPIHTFKAENKLLQLIYANKVGLKVPKTLIANTNNLTSLPSNNLVVKSIDTALLKIHNNEAFVYSNVISKEELNESNLSLIPVTIQECITPKIDVRVTIIGNKAFAVKILKNQKGISTDWRQEKNELEYVPFSLDKRTVNKCLKLMKLLNLNFGGIDLIESNGKYYFIEVNPTGEWGWLVEKTDLPINKEISQFLSSSKKYIFNLNIDKLKAYIHNISPYLLNTGEKVIQGILPFLFSYKANKMIDKSISNYISDETIGIKLEDSKSFYDRSLEYKNNIEDKAKTNIVGITLASTVMSSSLFLGKDFSLNIIGTLTLIPSLIYFLLGGLMALSTIQPKSIYTILPKDIESIENQSLKYLECAELNNKVNLKMNNSLSASYSCIKMGLLLLFLFFILSLIFKNNNNSLNNLVNIFIY